MYWADNLEAPKGIYHDIPYLLPFVRISAQPRVAVTEASNSSSCRQSYASCLPTANPGGGTNVLLSDWRMCRQGIPELRLRQDFRPLRLSYINRIVVNFETYLAALPHPALCRVYESLTL